MMQEELQRMRQRLDNAKENEKDLVDGMLDVFNMLQENKVPESAKPCILVLEKIGKSLWHFTFKGYFFLQFLCYIIIRISKYFYFLSYTSYTSYLSYSFYSMSSKNQKKDDDNLRKYAYDLVTQSTPGATAGRTAGTPGKII